MSLAAACQLGCQTGKPVKFPSPVEPHTSLSASSESIGQPAVATRYQHEIRQVDFQQPVAADGSNREGQTEDIPTTDQPPTTTDAVPPSLQTPIQPRLPGDAPGPFADSGSQLSLDDILVSVTECYPEIEVAMAEIRAAEGKLLSTYGEFDTSLGGFSFSEPLGFYQTYRNQVGLVRPLYGGGELYANYKLGRGFYPTWYGDRETNDGGEFKAGFAVPLQKGRDIDPRRAALLSAAAAVDEVEANVGARLLMLQRIATQSYWEWVASGQVIDVQQRLLNLALQRVDQINQRVEAGDLARIAQIDNQRFIAKRQNTLIKARRGLEKSAIKLSLFYRAENCAPVVANSQQLPDDFPAAQRISDQRRDADITTAIQVRPELAELQAARQQACVDLRYANNLLLPKIDMKGFAAQDVGAPTPKGDKTPFQLELGLIAEVPIQRREAQGKIQVAQNKIAQIDAKSRFITDKIRAEIQDAASAVNAAFEQIEQSSKNVELARQSLELGRKLFLEGDIDLIELNIYESAVGDAELELLEGKLQYFVFLTIYETAKTSASFASQ